MPRGKVVSFSAPKGFGFVEQGLGKPDLFIHWSSIQGEGYKRLDPGDVVDYELEIGPKGKPQASDVRVVQKAMA